MTNIISFKKAKSDLETKKEFLSLLDADIEKNKDSIEAIPQSVMNRAAIIRQKALEAKEQEELLEM